MSPTKVLVVDDSRMVRAMVEAALAPQGFLVIHGIDGVDALQKLGAHPDVALVVLDIHMPRMDGMDVLRLMQRGAQAPIPVIMLTTEGQPEIVQKARQLGARGWIVKPFDAAALVDAVRRLLSPSDGAGEGARGTGT